jgi:hypothetical protein
MLHNKLLRVVQARLLGFSTGIMLSWKRFCLFCLFHTSLSVAACLVQLVSTNFPNRVINRALLDAFEWYKSKYPQRVMHCLYSSSY